MAKGNNLQDLSQIDYCLQQYYSKYMAATLLQEQKENPSRAEERCHKT